ncbi:hypothetical protein PS870_06512 [Pseudomonas fluorescens]|uniref:Uncharacterized protein n=1 Tax=Pseudomonas fluorescens TaxID=294 RepID=A0A5E7QT04_PSEFL|nr:hypothetical protein [Pseudomonas fluorescens]VVP62043.1 hypothetical protein PS870_06512 [Pseudomonas fluorescens]
MNQTIQQSQAALQALRGRVSLSTSEMYKMIGREEPVRPSRFTVVPLGKNTFDVIDRSTDLSRGARTGHDNACHYAQQLEERANFFASVCAITRYACRTALRWTVGIAIGLVVFAYYGAGH